MSHNPSRVIGVNPAIVILDILIIGKVSYYTKRSQVDSNTVVSLRIKTVVSLTDGSLKSRLLLKTHSLSKDTQSYEDNFRGLKDINEILLRVTRMINES